MIRRRQTKKIFIGDVPIGGDAPIVVQSMTNTDTRDWRATVRQIDELTEVGCEIIRVAVPDREAAEQLPRIKSKIKIPLIADIHFDYRLALLSLKAGVDALRINPGNIGGKEATKKVVRLAKERRVPIRIGVNSGSLEKRLLEKYGHPTPEALAESALGHIQILESLDFDLIKVSIKSSDVLQTVDAYKLLSEKVRYPLHLGITEAGTLISGSIKSALGIGILLYEGIGDTIRVSLTSEPINEIKVAYAILRSLHIRERGVEIISCPTCGRTEIDLIPLVEKAEKVLAKIEKPLKVAIMGCVVNGPGEAKEADVGVAGGRGVGILFKKGQVIGKVREEELLSALLKEVYSMAGK